jgi:hypothetical protein
MGMIGKCKGCGASIVFGKKVGDDLYCDTICYEFHRFPGFCPNCTAETTGQSPGSTFTLNGIGTKLYGSGSKCPTCSSVIKRLWFCVLYIPVIPLGKFRIKQARAKRYIGRQLVGKSRLDDPHYAFAEQREAANARPTHMPPPLPATVGK